MKRDDRSDMLDPAGLDALFADLRSPAVAVPEALMARVLADADQLQAVAARVAPSGPVLRGGWRAVLGAVFGGGASLAGLAVAGAAGVWIGFAQPFDVDFGLGLQAATLDVVEFSPADLDQWSETLAPDLLADN